MYLYSFDLYAGFDRVYKAESSVKLSAGDLIQFGNSKFLVLGDKVPFEELYDKHKLQISAQPEILYKKFFSQLTLDRIYYLVYTYYTSYYNIVALFVDDDISRFLLSQSPIKRSPESQTLVVFPDLWSASNFDKSNLKISLDGVSILHGQSTVKQKISTYWGIKTGKQSILACTYSQIFKDYPNLQKIIVVDTHKWYYKNQQDPRYAVISVLEKLSELTGAEIEEIGFRI